MMMRLHIFLQETLCGNGEHDIPSAFNVITAVNEIPSAFNVITSAFNLIIAVNGIPSALI